jgi:hypothetical protein
VRFCIHLPLIWIDGGPRCIGRCADGRASESKEPILKDSIQALRIENDWKGHGRNPCEKAAGNSPSSPWGRFKSRANDSREEACVQHEMVKEITFSEEIIFDIYSIGPVYLCCAGFRSNRVHCKLPLEDDLHLHVK